MSAIRKPIDIYLKRGYGASMFQNHIHCVMFELTAKKPVI